MAFLRVYQVATQIGHSEATVRRWIKAGLIPAIKPGKHILIDQADLDAFLTGRPSNLDTWVSRIVDQAPDLSPEQVSRLRDALGRSA